MKARGWVVRHRRLTRAVLLGACLLLGAGRLFGQRVDTAPATAQREVIATTVPVTPQTPPAPLPLPNTRLAAPTAGEIQQASFVPEPSAPSTSPSPAAATQGASMLPPNALFREMKASTVPTDSRPTNSPAGTAAAVTVEVVGPDRLLLGKPLAYEIVLRNTGGRPVAELHVEEPLPAGARPLKTDPPAMTKDNRLVWDLRNLEAGGERRLKVELQPGRHGELDLRPYVTFLCGEGLRTKVTRPPFSVEMRADHDKAPRGGRIRFTIIVANHGEAPISNIYLYDQLPPGLHHPQGPKIGTERFNLQPEEMRTITLETTGVESGTFRNEVAAFADQGVEARTALDVVITEPSLTLRLDGPTQTVTQREEDFHLEASNPGTLPAKNVLLFQALPPTVDVVWASSGATLDNKQHALVWSLSDLTAGQRQTVTFRVRASLAGDWPLIAAVQSQNLPETRVNHMLHADAAAALKLDVRAREERLAIGAETIFSVHVFNNGDAPCSGPRLTAQLPEALTPLDAKGPTAGKVEKQQVSFAPLAQLDAHGDVVYRIRVRGGKAGKGALRVELTADKQPPAQREISIQVHGEEHAAAQAATSEMAKVGPP